jgi:hypothetical protein
MHVIRRPIYSLVQGLPPTCLCLVALDMLGEPPFKIGTLLTSDVPDAILVVHHHRRLAGNIIAARPARVIERRAALPARQPASRHRGISTQCPLYPRKRTWISTAVMSALCQKQTLQSCQPLLEVMANFRQQLARTKRFRHVVITTRCSRLLFFPIERIRGNRDNRDRS